MVDRMNVFSRRFRRVSVLASFQKCQVSLGSDFFPFGRSAFFQNMISFCSISRTIRNPPSLHPKQPVCGCFRLCMVLPTTFDQADDWVTIFRLHHCHHFNSVFRFCFCGFWRFQTFKIPVMLIKSDGLLSNEDF